MQRPYGLQVVFADIVKQNGNTGAAVVEIVQMNDIRLIHFQRPYQLLCAEIREQPLKSNDFRGCALC